MPIEMDRASSYRAHVIVVSPKFMFSSAAEPISVDSFLFLCSMPEATVRIAKLPKPQHNEFILIVKVAKGKKQRTFLVWHFLCSGQAD